MSPTVNLLFIEDNPGDIQLLKIHLREYNGECKYTFLTSGEEAQDYLQHKPEEMPNIIVVDLNLPQVSGLDLLKQIRSVPYHQDTPIVVFSSSSSDSDIERANAYQISDYLVKPDDLDAYGQAVEQIMQLARVNAE